MGAESFRQQLAAALARRQWKLPRLAQVSGYNRVYLWEIATGRKQPNLNLVIDLDTALGAGGTLTGSWQEGTDVLARRQVLSGIAASATALPALRASVTPLLAGLDTALFASQPVALVPVARLDALAAAARRDFMAVRYTQLAAKLPQLISAATACRDQAGHGERARFDTALAEGYVLANELAIKLHQHELAWVLADRAVQAARSSGDPLTVARAMWRASIVLRRSRHREAAGQLIADAAREFYQATDLQTAVYAGQYARMLCCSAYTAAMAERRTDAYTLLAQAREVVTEHGQQHFTFDDVRLYGISVARAVGDFGQALQFSGEVTTGALSSDERRVRFWEDTAIAWWGRGRPAETFSALLAAERTSPQEVRFRPWAHRLTVNLLGCGPGVIGLSGLREFATRAGVI